MIITHCIHFKQIPNNVLMFFHRTKILASIRQFIFRKFFKAVRCIYVDKLLFVFQLLTKLPLSSYDKYLKSLSHRFLINLFRLEFVHCMLSIKTKLLLIVKTMNFWNPFGIKFNFTSNLFIFCMTKWLS